MAAKAVSQYPPPPKKYYKTSPLPPPPPPPETSYTSFGGIYQTTSALPTLTSANRPILYDETLLPINPCKVLRELNKKLLEEYREYLHEICGGNIEKTSGRIKMLEDLFVNMHHVVNILRPVLARGVVREVVEKQGRERERVAEVVGKAVEWVRGEVEVARKGLENGGVVEGDVEEDGDVVMGGGEDGHRADVGKREEEDEWDLQIQMIIDDIAKNQSLL